MSLPSIALPGQLLGPSSKYAPGPGTHLHESQIYASIAGPVKSSRSKPTKSSTSTTSKSSTLPLLTILRAPPDPIDPGILGVNSGGGSTVLPEVESTILGRIIRLGPRFASVDILVVDSHVCREAFQGMIRREDIRATEKDKVKVEESFRVGDLVRGVVISLGDQSNYYISTAENELGVIMAKSEAGKQMYPVSWKEFRDPATGKLESRKVAKPF